MFYKEHIKVIYIQGKFIGENSYQQINHFKYNFKY